VPTGLLGTVRKVKRCVGPVSFLPLDFDDVAPETIVGVLNLIESLNLSAFAYSTWKQPEASQKGLARVRVFIAISRRVTPRGVADLLRSERTALRRDHCRRDCERADPILLHTSATRGR
jgi:hypothetical protein